MGETRLDAKGELLETYLVAISRPGPNWGSALPGMAAMAERHHAIYASLVEDGLLISAGRLDGTPEMGISLFHRHVEEQAVRARLESDEFVTLGYLTLDFRHWALLSGSLAGVKGSSEG
jgi:hypothetical protein